MEEKRNADEFQGYPHYPGKEDITRGSNNNGKERLEQYEPEQVFDDAADNRDMERKIVTGTEADITAEDLEMLEYAEQNMQSDELNRASLDSVDGEDDLLNEQGTLYKNTAGSSLDVPGSDADDAAEQIGAEDEENNYYSLGGDEQSALDESRD
jgi:hypothetical protein